MLESSDKGTKQSASRLVGPALFCLQKGETRCFTLILFDLDGTLTDSREGIVNSVKYTIEKLGGTMPDAQTLLKFIGPPLQESFMEHCGYSREKAVEGVRVFREHYVPGGTV